MVIWITGLSGSGKTTLSEALVALLKDDVPELFHVDGDIIREMYGHDIDHSEQSRKKQIGRIQKLTKFLADQGLVVIVAALYAHPDLLKWNREYFSPYYEIYLEAELGLVKSRDAKGLYAKAEAGEMSDVVGIDIPWHAPVNADLTINAATVPDADELARQIAAKIPRFAAVLSNRKKNLS